MALGFKKKDLESRDLSKVEIPSYKNLEKIFESSRSRVFRATRMSDGRKVVLKILQEEFLERNEILRYKNQFEILKENPLACSPKVLDLSKHRNSPMIVFEDSGLDSLSVFLQKKQLRIADAIEIMIRLCEAVSEVHKHNIIHKDINPNNILFDLATKKVQLIDFGISTQLSRVHASVSLEGITEGSLPYMSPEQTGRMNRYVDNRSDLYSLGIVMYELLVGELPFYSDDPLQLIHHHIAKRPTAPHEKNMDIPSALSKVVLKLLAKNVEDRYQSAWGLRTDLLECQKQFENSGFIREFPLGLQDVSSQLQISQSLYGRADKLEQLQHAYKRVLNGDRLAVFISGYPGVGKTSLCKELYKQVYRDNGFYISGKFETIRRSVPYSGITDALNELCRQLLSEPEQALKKWKARILDALAGNGQVLIDLIPELEHIIGPQQELSVLGAADNENRFRLVFKRFMEVFADRSRPLVIYLDDLQWIDLSSVKLIKSILEDRVLQGVLLIGSYRDKDLGGAHPLFSMLDKMNGNGIELETIHLEPLKQNDIDAMISDTLQMDLSNSLSLSKLVYEKTGGNPFFTEEFLKKLKQNKLLQFDDHRGRWVWDIEKIRLADLSDNVVELMAEKIKDLPSATMDLVCYGACIGMVFDIDTLANIAQSSVEKISRDLHEAIESGLIIPIDESYRIIELEVGGAGEPLDVKYRFAHDRIMQAANDLIELRKRKVVRRRIAQIYIEKHPRFQEENTFVLVNHLNFAAELLQSNDEKILGIQLNLRAIKKAKKSSAFSLAYEYVEQTLQYIEERFWKNQRDLLIEFYQESCEVAYLTSHQKQAEGFAKVVIERSLDLLDKIPVYETQIQSAIARNDMAAALEQGQTILAQLGVKVNSKPGMVKILWGFARSWLALLGKSDTKILAKEEPKSPYIKARMHFQYSLSQCLFLYLPKQVPISICDTVQLSLKHGVSATSALAFTSYGIMMSGIFSAFNLGYRFGELGIKIYKKLEARELEAAILVSHNLYIRPWNDPIRSTLPALQEAYHSGIESGSLEFAIHGAMGHCYRAFLAGLELDSVLKDMEHYQESIQSLGYEGNTYILNLYQQTVMNLRTTECREPWRIKGEAYDDDAMILTHRQNKDAAGLFLTYFLKQFMAYQFDQTNLALEWGEAAKREFKAGINTYNGTVFYFYHALTLLRCIEKNPEDSRAYLSEFKSLLTKFRKWSKSCAENQAHRYLILKAEYYRLQNREYKAQSLFDAAISKAKQNEFFQDEALANELAARFHLAGQRYTMASAYMKRARYSYQRWGALGKVEDLERKYPQLISSPGERNITSSMATMSSSTIDITTLKKALLAIAEETIHSQMLEKIISSSIEFAGAQRGALLLKKDGEFFVEAESSTDLERPLILQSIPLNQSNKISVQVLNYVKRTAKAMVIDDAMHGTDLLPGLDQDPYIKQNKIKSILCIPILIGGHSESEMIGLLYLENNHTSNTFTMERIETLEIISLSAAGRLELSVRAATDGLTGLYNHEYFQNMLEQEILQSQRQLRNLSLVMIDIDHFKSFNDQWGHQVGDLVLKRVADVVKQTCRKSDIVARYGGEELSVILPETNSDLAAVVAERIRANVEQEVIDWEGHQLNVRVSIGVSYLKDDLRTASALIKIADEALYTSKNEGRNRVTIS